MRHEDWRAAFSLKVVVPLRWRSLMILAHENEHHGGICLALSFGVLFSGDGAWQVCPVRNALSVDSAARHPYLEGGYELVHTRLR
jgi:hypothetical protein